MAPTTLLVDLGRAYEVLGQVDESKLEYAPDGDISDDIRQATGLQSYPVGSHKENLHARIDAVVKAGDKLSPRAPSEYVSKLIVDCIKLAPSSDDRKPGML